MIEEQIPDYSDTYLIIYYMNNEIAIYGAIIRHHYGIICFIA